MIFFVVVVVVQNEQFPQLVAILTIALWRLQDLKRLQLPYSSTDFVQNSTDLLSTVEPRYKEVGYNKTLL